MNTFFMDTVFDSSIALLGVLMPLGLAYIILLWQGHTPDADHRKGFATTHDGLAENKTKPSHADE
jgi:hypothetical protein